MWSLGIDPGRDGAAVLIAPDGVAEVLWTWRTSAKDARGSSHINLRVVQEVDGGVHVLDLRAAGPHAMGAILGAQVLAVTSGEPCALAHEGVWTPRGKGGGGVQSAIKLALWTGRLLGPVEAACGSAAVVYQPATWRKVTGVGNERGHKERAQQVIPEKVRGIAALIRAAGRPASSTHEYEAGGVALCLHRSGSTTSSESPSPTSSTRSACPNASGRGARAPRARRRNAGRKTDADPSA